MKAAVRIIALLVTMSLQTACVSQRGGYFSPGRSVDEVSIVPGAAIFIAGDMTSKLSEHIGRSQGTVVMAPDDSLFGTALEKSLRNWGYAVETKKGENVYLADSQGIPLAYAVISLDGQILVRISTTYVELSRIYSQTPTGAVAASPLSVMQASMRGSDNG